MTSIDCDTYLAYYVCQRRIRIAKIKFLETNKFNRLIKQKIESVSKPLFVTREKTKNLKNN